VFGRLSEMLHAQAVGAYAVLGFHPAIAGRAAVRGFRDAGLYLLLCHTRNIYLRG
jgi:hypothetical protein